jgi:serine/threonine-protein kinase
MSNRWKQPGIVLAGKYRLERVLGEGAMGIVLAVRHLALGELMAMKLIHSDGSQQPEIFERFRREARAMMRIQSEHVVRTIDCGILEDDTPYLVMEYLEGQDLAQCLAQTGPLPLWQVAEYMMQTCEALAHAHALGIVHRDLKPSNLFIVQRRDGRKWVKVIDFGIAKLSESGMTVAGMRLTKTAQVMGSPLYMAPEQMTSSKNVDARADIWSLGIVMFELLSGYVPFVGKTVVSLYRDITSQETPSLLRYRPDLTEEFHGIVRRCLMKDREQRYPTVVELCAALRPFATPQCHVQPEQLANILGPVAYPVSRSSPPVISSRPSCPSNVTGAGSTQQVFGRTTLHKSNQHVGGWLFIAFSFTCVMGLLVNLLLRRVDFATNRGATSAAATVQKPTSTNVSSVVVASAIPSVVVPVISEHQGKPVATVVPKTRDGLEVPPHSSAVPTEERRNVPPPSSSSLPRQADPLGY